MPSKNDRTGEIAVNTNGSKMKIIKYKNKDDIDVLFIEQNYIKKNVKYRAFLKGNVKSPYDKSVYGVGYIGEGKYSHKEYSTIYNSWANMIQRCYLESFHIKQPSYKDCHVCSEWHNFQTFAKWYEANAYNTDSKLELDKDILFKNNKIYSPKTCVLVPKNINILLVKANSIRGKYPIGVSLLKNGKFKASITINNKAHHLGNYNTSDLAFEAYKQAKEEYIKSKAQEHYDIIPESLYNALMSYEVSKED
jgi:hypothetical protein